MILTSKARQSLAFLRWKSLVLGHVPHAIEKMAYFREVEMNYIFKTQHRIVTMLTENILLKIRIIFIEEMGIQ